LVLAQQIRDHVSRIDGDQTNPTSFFPYRFGTGGYWAFRIGGNLRARLTCRLCPSVPSIDKEAIKKHVEQHPAFRGWDDCKIRNDDPDAH
jgi:hypothetical protein